MYYPAEYQNQCRAEANIHATISAMAISTGDLIDDFNSTSDELRHHASVDQPATASWVIGGVSPSVCRETSFP
jgi:hypothetical protein